MDQGGLRFGSRRVKVWTEVELRFGSSRVKVWTQVELRFWIKIGLRFRLSKG